jgi:hypothetical protein
LSNFIFDYIAMCTSMFIKIIYRVLIVLFLIFILFKSILKYIIILDKLIMILIYIFKKSKLIYVINKIIGFKWSNLNIYLYIKNLNE